MEGHKQEEEEDEEKQENKELEEKAEDSNKLDFILLRKRKVKEWSYKNIGPSKIVEM